MKKSVMNVFACALLVVAPIVAQAQKQDPMVGGAAMYASKPIPVNASAAPNLTTLVTAVKAAGLVDTLAGPGPFTVFAPTNDAFAKLPDGTVSTLVQPENKAKLTSILTYHVVPGIYDSQKLIKEIKKGHGTATLKTVQGEPLSFAIDGNAIKITDAKGGSAEVTTADVYQSNGVVHVIDSVLMP
ncbi:fasciclin domain-containing protein [Silvibacterium sp.]|uniref:fasciclin domain-containing protein n=1 Tax=Silvibacterium sp. TaxID=1964179 RepID=UPI0039E27EF0